MDGEGFNIFKDIFKEGKAESAINWPLLTSFFLSLNILLLCAYFLFCHLLQ